MKQQSGTENNVGDTQYMCVTKKKEGTVYSER